MRLTAGTRSYLLAFADDEHLMGQQHTEWIGVAPFLEEDLAFSSIGQDELGHAAMLYEVILDADGVSPSDTAIDALAYRRSAADYRSCRLVEYRNGDWATALVRHWVYDTVEQARWGLLENSTMSGLAGLAAHATREESFHRLHANTLLDVLLQDGEARERILSALHRLETQISGLIAPIPGENEAVSAGVAKERLCDFAPELEAAIGTRFGVCIRLDAGEADAEFRLARSEDFGPLMARMREVLDFDPAATW
ncbi:MAG: phenylacetate-CoA oxygenase subunit PaaC [Acidobacteria bacterium]|nr:phenylacetate-CoA oxygenase subunit PaaC [Acidobacteriota bacterium]